MQVQWSGPNNSPLPHDVTELDGNVLDFSNGRTELNGDYTCTATNPVGEVIYADLHSFSGVTLIVSFCRHLTTAPSTLAHH